MKKIAILGSTGSIGTQALEVLRLHKDAFQVVALTADKNADLLFRQVEEFHPSFAGLTGYERNNDFDHLPSFCRFFFGKDALKDVTEHSGADAVLVAVSGMVGLSAVLAALKCNIQVLLANKESLVAGGELVMHTCEKSRLTMPILPVDSEHSAIFQCLQGNQGNEPTSLILTASGGPFRSFNTEKLSAATPEMALRHPNWNMGRKITIDSATMFNKALEIIEASWLFHMPQKKIEVFVHPQSIIHSAVRFRDGAVLAQLGVPDMRLPILYALSFPQRLETGAPPLDFSSISSLTFECPDDEKFPAMRLAREALDAGGILCCALNAANEVAVQAFLNHRIRFMDIYRIVDQVLQHTENYAADYYEAILCADNAARSMADDFIVRTGV